MNKFPERSIVESFFPMHNVNDCILNRIEIYDGED